MSQITTGIETIDPTEAKRLLGLNTHNRAISQTRVRTMARDMSADKWVLNGETIKVSVNDKLLDGQHRLLAVVESKASIMTLIVRGLPDEAQDTVDIGAKRQFKDVLSLAGEKNVSNIAASVRTAWYMDNFGVPRKFEANPSTPELQAWLDNNPGIRDSHLVGDHALRGVLRYPASSATCLHYLMGRLSAEDRDDFWEQLVDGTASRGNPIFVLRELLLRELGRPHRMSITHRMALTIKAWNAYRTGKVVQTLYWRPGSGKGFEEFPKLK